MPLDLFSLPKERRDVLRNLLFENVDKKGKNDCWEWTARKTNKNYGLLRVRIDNNVYFLPAHRVSWSLHYNTPIPPGLFCCHSCDNRPCINPVHIFLGTQKHNIQDCINKGRFKNEDPWGNRKRALKRLPFYIEVAKKIQQGESIRGAAKKYNITLSVLSEVIKRPEIISAVGEIKSKHKRIGST